MKDRTPEELLAQYSEARQKLLEATARFQEQLKGKGIDPGFIVEQRKDEFLDCWEAFENACQQNDPPLTVVWIDQAEYADYWSAKWEFASVQRECREVLEELFSEYEAWQKKWGNHFYRKYGIHPAGGFGPDMDAETVSQYEADQEQKRQEHDDWKVKLYTPKVPVPDGWEAARPKEEIKSPADLEVYLADKLRTVRGVSKSIPEVARAFQEAGREAIRNAYLVFDQLRIFDRPDRPNSSDGHAVEAALSDLLAWIRKQVGETADQVEGIGQTVTDLAEPEKPTDAVASRVTGDEQAEAKPPSDKPKPKVDDRMKAEMAGNLETVKGWTAQQWADHLGCGKTTVIDTQTWKSLSLLRQQAKAEKRKDKRGTKPVGRADQK